MNLRVYVWLIPLIILVILTGCSAGNNNNHKTLSLSLVSEEGRLNVSAYRVLENPFQESQQQGLYQAHLIDEKGNILQRISFEKLEIPAVENGSSNAGFTVTLPLRPNLNRIILYKLDGSSGHYQLKADDPLLNWKLPKSVKEKNITARQQ